MAQSKLIIKDEDLVENFFDGAFIAGIIAPMADYKLIWHINKLLGLNFKINHQNEVRLIKKTRNYYFPIFEYKPAHSFKQYYLYNNEDDGEFLLPEYKHFDFIFIVNNPEMLVDEWHGITETLKKIPSLQLVTTLTHDKIINKKNLLI